MRFLVIVCHYMSEKLQVPDMFFVCSYLVSFINKSSQHHESSLIEGFGFSRNSEPQSSFWGLEFGKKKRHSRVFGARMIIFWAESFLKEAKLSKKANQIMATLRENPAKS